MNKTSGKHSVKQLQRCDVQPHFGAELMERVSKHIGIVTRPHKAVQLPGQSSEQSLFDRVHPGERYM